MRDALQLGCLAAAFWVALGVYWRREPSRDGSLRFAVGLACGAAFAHLGWVLLYLDRVREHPLAVLSPAGFCVLFVPLGLLAVTPWSVEPPLRERFVSAGFASLPLALATARLGCVAAGCCGGVATDLPWGLRLGGGLPRHPTALYEIAGLLALHVGARRLPARLVAPLVVAGLGGLRLAIDPLRAAPPLGAPLVSPSWLAAAWLAAGIGIAALSRLAESRSLGRAA